MFLLYNSNAFIIQSRRTRCRPVFVNVSVYCDHTSNTFRLINQVLDVSVLRRMFFKGEGYKVKSRIPYGITQCYLPPGRGDIPAFTPAEAGTRFSDPGGMQG